MVTRTDLMRLPLSDKRMIAGALLRSVFDAPRTFPLSFAQEQLWFMDKLQPGLPVYNIPLYVPFAGTLDVACLRRALEALGRRHDMLRARFDSAGDAPVQVIEPEVPMNLPVEDLSGLPAAQRESALGRLLNEEVQKPFALGKGACVRYRLFRLDPANHLLSVTMHHIVTDAWSLGVFIAELNALYEGFRSGQKSVPLAPLQIEYCDYAQWQRSTLRGLRLRKLVKYWTEQLAGAPHVLRLPTDHPRPKDRTFAGTVAGFSFDDDLSGALASVAREHKVTLFMLLLACFYVLLFRYTGQLDILVGAPVANRGRAEFEPILGLFVNTLVLRVVLQDDLTFAELLRRVQVMSLGAFEHQALPFDQIVAELNVERVPGVPPLYQVVFNFQNASLIDSAAPSAEGEWLSRVGFPLVHSNTAKVDLNLTMTQNGPNISGGIEYNTDLFEPGTIDTMILNYKSIARAAATDPSIPIVDMPLTSSEDAGRAVEPAYAGFARGVPADLASGGKFSFELGD